MHVIQPDAKNSVPDNHSLGSDFPPGLDDSVTPVSLDNILEIADPIHTGVLVFDLQGRLSYQTEKTRALKLIPSKPSSKPRSSIAEFFSSSVPLDVDSETWQRVMAGEVVRFPHALPEPIQACILHLEITLQKVVLQSGVYIICYLQDITAHQLRESELGEYRERLELVETTLCAGFAKWDLPGQEVSLTDRQAEIFGIDPSDFDGTFETFFQYLHPDDQQKVIQGLMQDDSIEYRVIDSSRRTRQVLSKQRVIDDGGQPVILQVTVDVTELMELYKAAQQSA